MGAPIENIKHLKEKLHETEEVLEDERRRLIETEKMASMGVLSAGIAHEIGNPLGAIRGRLEMLEEMFKQQNIRPDIALASVEKMIVSVDRMAKIIRAIKNFSRDGSGDPKIAFDVTQLIGDIVEVSFEKCQKNGIDLHVQGIDSPIFLQGRETEIGQVIVNLINNAFDAVKVRSDAWISIVLQVDDKRCAIIFKDSGGGVPEFLQNKIFDPFFTTKRVGEGTGLGLSICRSIIEDHQGTLVYEKLEPHTSFRVTLPFEQS